MFVHSAIIILLLVSVGHLGCYPLLTLSTFEAKPRGVYFEENALLPGATPASFALPTNDAYPSEEFVSCREVERRGFPCFHLAGENLVWTYATPMFTDDSKEIIVLVVLTSPGASFHPAFLSLLSHVHSSKYLAKNVALLFTSNSSSIERWLELYREAQVSNFRRKIFPLVGTIRASLLIECPNQASSAHNVVLKMGGTDGRLPNQDLPNLVSHAFRGRTSFEDSTYASHLNWAVLWKSSFGVKFTALLKFVRAIGIHSTGSHGDFLRY